MQRTGRFSLVLISASVALSIVLSSCTNNTDGLKSARNTKQEPQGIEQKRQTVLAALTQRVHKEDLQNKNQSIAELPAPERKPNSAFDPDVRPLLEPGFTATPSELDQPTRLASAAEPKKPSVQNRRSAIKTGNVATNLRGLSRFQAKLAALKSGQRSKPVTILHIGDSHVASDSFSRGIRRSLQAEFGNAGRGAVIPANAYKYGVADNVSLKASGSWYAKTALRSKSGPYGLSGAQVSSRSSRASMTMTAKDGPFDWAEATVVTGPSQGAFDLVVGKTKKRFDAWSKNKGSKTFRLEIEGNTVKLSPAGGGRTSVLSWATGKNQPGIRYVNFGLIGATVNVTKRFDSTLMANDIRQLDPDLIVYGYGTNEGFNDRLDLKSYAKIARRFVGKLKSAAPNADVVYIGAASGLRRKARGGRTCGRGWWEPRRLNPLRTTMKNLAKKTGAAYWDWSKAMGGPCAVNRWAKWGMAAKDRIHLTSKGYEQSSQKFANWLMTHQHSGLELALKTQ